jgi:hypothetical protein
MARDWVRWHDAYDDPSSGLSTRLALVQAHLSTALYGAPAGPVTLLSLCAGQGRDVTAVLPSHPRRDDVSAVLVELDPVNANSARAAVAETGLAGVTVREADAGAVGTFADVLPADVLLLCGIFGNVSGDDIRRTVTSAAAMCRPGATVIWTRHRRPPDFTGQIRTWFAASGFDEVAFDTPETTTMTGVGVHRLSAAPAPAPLPDGRLFTFRADG